MADDPTGDARGALQSGLAGNDSLRWAVADFTRLVEEARRRQDLSPLAAAALGRLLTGAALLLRLSLKIPSRLLIDVRGDGPLGRILVEVDSEGNARGTVQHPRVQLSATSDGKLNVGAGVGRGVLRVRRDYRQGFYDSEVELVTGEIGDDLAHFLEQSEQTRAAVLVGVLTKPGGIAGAGGALIEALPGCPEATVERLEHNLGELASVSARIERGGVQAILEPVLSGLDWRVLATSEFRYRCRCTRERVARHLRSLSSAELAGLCHRDRSLSAECVFCGEVYRFPPGEWSLTDSA